MNLLHFSDLHLWRRAFDFGDPAFKRVLGLGNLLLRRGRAFPPAYSRATVEALATRKADALVFSGDLTTTALDAEFRDAADCLAPLREQWGERFLLLPGNHDRYTPRTLRRRSFETCFPWAAFDNSARPVRALALDDRLAVVGFDASVPRRLESTGAMTPALAEALDAELARQTDAGRRCILVGHYPYAAPPPVRIARGHRLVGAERLVEIVRRHAPILYLHGHKHRRWAFFPEATPETLCVNAGSAGLATSDPFTRAGFVEIRLGREETDAGGPTPDAPEDRTPVEAGGGWRPVAVEAFVLAASVPMTSSAASSSPRPAPPSLERRLVWRAEDTPGRRTDAR